MFTTPIGASGFGLTDPELNSLGNFVIPMARSIRYDLHGITPSNYNLLMMTPHTLNYLRIYELSIPHGKHPHLSLSELIENVLNGLPTISTYRWKMVNQS